MSRDTCANSLQLARTSLHTEVASKECVRMHGTQRIDTSSVRSWNCVSGLNVEPARELYRRSSKESVRRNATRYVHDGLIAIRARSLPSSPNRSMTSGLFKHETPFFESVRAGKKHELGDLSHQTTFSLSRGSWPRVKSIAFLIPG